MATRKSNANTEQKQIEIPKDITQCTFWKRLPYQLEEEQWNYIKAIWDKKNLMVMVDACAGSSKTTLAVGMALLMYELGIYKKIYYIVSPCQEQELGYRPGQTGEKLMDYSGPLYDALMVWGYDPNKTVISDMNMEAVKNGTAFVYLTSDVFLRGCNLSEAFVIIDEAQNSKQLKKIISRCHDNCKVVCAGHCGQTDLRFPQDSQFPKYLTAARRVDFIKIIELTKNYRGKLSQFADEVY